MRAGDNAIKEIHLVFMKIDGALLQFRLNYVIIMISIDVKHRQVI